MPSGPAAIEPVEIGVYVRFQDDDPTRPRISTLSYFDEKMDKVAGVELRLDLGVEYRLVFSIVGPTSVKFKPGSIEWTNIQDPTQRTAPPPAARSTSISADGKSLEILWQADASTPYVNMFTAVVFKPSGGATAEGTVDPTIVNKPPE